MTVGHKELLQSCFVLHRRPYRETSAIVELFSEKHGRVAVIAKGVRGRRQSTQALLEPFCPVLVSWQGKGELPTLTSIESDGQPLQLLGANLLSGFYLNELIIRLLHKGEPFLQLFAQYRDAIAMLASDTRVDIVLRLFEKSLLENLGYALVLNHDGDTGEPVNEHDFYQYIFEHGPVRLNDVTNTAHAISGKSLLDLDAGNLNDAQTRQDAKKLMKNALKPLLGSQPLRSRELYSEILATHKTAT